MSTPLARGDSQYDPERTPILLYRLALLGLTDEEIRDTIMVPQNTWDDWIKRYPEMLKNIAKGRKIADAHVAQALYKKATGFSVEDTFVTVQKGQVYKVPIIKYYPPDTQAAIFWLKNKTRSNEEPFADKHEIELSKEERRVLDLMDLDLTDFSEQELKVLDKLISKLPDKAAESFNEQGGVE